MREGSFRAGGVAAVLLVVATALASCGGGGGGDSETARYFPLAVGDHWTYDSDEHSRVTGLRTVNGESAFVVQSYDIGGNPFDETLYVVDSDGIRRLPDATGLVSAEIGPIQLMRFPVTAGDTFVQIDNATIDLDIDLDGDGRGETLSYFSQVTVLGFETVSTPAGTFTNTAHQRTELRETLTYSRDGSRDRGTSVVDEWFAPGVGLVRQTRTIGYGGQSQSWSTLLAAYSVGGERSESVPPTVVSVSPAADAIAGAGAVLRVDFSESMDPLTLTTTTIVVADAAGRAVPGTVQVGAQQATFVPSLGWSSGSYTARVTTGAMDRAGNALAAQHEWSFTLDTEAPAVTAVAPADGAVDVALDGVITFTFSEPVDPASVLDYNVYVIGYWQGEVFGQSIAKTVEVSGNTVTVRPLAPLPAAANIQVSIGGVRDTGGNTMRTSYGSAFRTSAGRFAYPALLPTGSSPVSSVAIGDVNGDSRPDVLLLTDFYFDPANDFRLFVFLQQADGTLAAPVKYDTGFGYSARGSSLVVVDIDGDGRNDVVIGEGDRGIEVFLQDAQGALASAFRLDGPAGKLRVVDADGDGRKDIIAFGFGSGSVRVWRQSAPGVFAAPASYAVEHAWKDLDVGDVNGDGRPDIVTGSWGGLGSNGLAVLLQQPDGSFGAPTYRTVDPTWGTGGIAVGDVNGDGRDDIVASWGGNSPTYIGILLQNADGSLGEMQTMPTLDIPAPVAIADIDGDGRKDIVVAHDGWTSISLYRQRADGTLMPQELFPSIYGSWEGDALAVGDINGDGRPDIVLGSQVLLQNAPAATPLAVPWRRPGSALQTVRRATALPGEVRTSR
jgi:hypothetical protein